MVLCILKAERCLGWQVWFTSNSIRVRLPRQAAYDVNAYASQASNQVCYLTQVCVDLTQVCVNLTQAPVTHLHS